MKIFIVLIAIAIFSGVLVSANLTYEVELEESDWPENEPAELAIYLPPVIDSVVGEFSLEKLMKYTKNHTEKAKVNFSYAINSYEKEFGSAIECKETAPTYFKQYRLFGESKYYWKWLSQCEFTKNLGKAEVQVYKSESGWVLSSFGISRL